MRETDNKQSAVLLTSEELRAKAISMSHRRGNSVAKRRIVRRWVAWFLWSWILPLIGLASLLAVVVAMVLVFSFGAATVISSTQAWLTERIGIQSMPTPELTQVVKPQELGREIVQNHTGGTDNTVSVLEAAPTMNLKIDRNIVFQNPVALPSGESISNPNSNNSQLLPKGNQP